MALSRLLARPLLASYFLANGANDIAHTPEIAAKVAPVTDRLAPAVTNATQGNVPVPSSPQGTCQPEPRSLGRKPIRNPQLKREHS